MLHAGGLSASFLPQMENKWVRYSVVNANAHHSISEMKLIYIAIGSWGCFDSKEHSLMFPASILIAYFAIAIAIASHISPLSFIELSLEARFEFHFYLQPNPLRSSDFQPYPVLL